MKTNLVIATLSAGPMTMKRPKAVLAIAGGIFIVAWFLPVVDGSSSLRQGALPGWEAFRYAFAPVWS